MTRAPNKTPRNASVTVALFFQPHEFKSLKHNSPGPSGKLGGYPRHENWLIAHTNQKTLCVVLDPTRLERTIRYCRSYGDGGPNRRLRSACIPALRRVGIDLQPEWRAP